MDSCLLVVWLCGGGVSGRTTLVTSHLAHGILLRWHVVGALCPGVGLSLDLDRDREAQGLASDRMDGQGHLFLPEHVVGEPDLLLVVRNGCGESRCNLHLCAEVSGVIRRIHDAVLLEATVRRREFEVRELVIFAALVVDVADLVLSYYITVSIRCFDILPGCRSSDSDARWGTSSNFDGRWEDLLPTEGIHHQVEGQGSVLA